MDDPHSAWAHESVSCRFNEIPSFVKTELEQLYGHLYSSLAFFEAYRPTENVGTYVVSRNGEPTTILLFSNKGRGIRVLNEMIRIDGKEVHRFVDYIFANYPAIDVVSFEAIQTDIQSLPFPYQRHNAKEDFVITLPGTEDEYTSRIGSATRRSIKRYMKRIARDFPGFESRFYQDQEIDERQIREIIGMSEIRISARKRPFSIDEDDIRRILRMIRNSGLVNVITIDGRVCAGTITCRFAGNYFSMVTAHAPQYDSYRLGTLSCYLTICEGISRGAKTFSLGGGRYDYKERLLAVRQDMDQLEIYRSYKRAFFNADQVLKTFFKSRSRRVKVWLLAREKSLPTQLALRLLLCIKALMRYAP